MAMINKRDGEYMFWCDCGTGYKIKDFDLEGDGLVNVEVMCVICKKVTRVTCNLNSTET